MIFTLNITSMMVLTSIYLSVSASLPNTSMIKPIEEWLLFNLTYPFMVILVNIVMQSLESVPTAKVDCMKRGKQVSSPGKKEKFLKLAHFSANFINPALYIGFCVVYFKIYYKF